MSVCKSVPFNDEKISMFEFVRRVAVITSIFESVKSSGNDVKTMHTACRSILMSVRLLSVPRVENSEGVQLSEVNYLRDRLHTRIMDFIVSLDL